MPTSYPFDPNGTRPENFILNENITLPVAAYRNFHFIVPQFAPFHKEDVVIRLHPSGVELVEGTDYWLTHKFTAATRSIGRPVYGSISFLNKNLAGTVSMDYRTVGGDWTQSPQKIIELLSNTINNPRITTWDMVADVPYAFPPTNHNWDVEDLKGMDDVVAAIDAMTEAIIASRLDAWNAHIANITGNPHNTTKAQVGLGNVMNYAVATQAQALEATNNTTYLTPLRARQLFQSLVDQINDGEGGGGSGSGDVIGPVGAINGSIPSYDGATGKVLDDLEQMIITVTGTVQSVVVGHLSGGRNTEFGLRDSSGEGYQAKFRVINNSLTATRVYDLPDRDGKVVLDVDVDMDPGTIIYRSAGATGRGLADSQAPISIAATANSVPLRDGNGRLVVASAVLTTQAINLGQAASLYVPLIGNGLVPYSNVIQALPITPTNDTLLSAGGLKTLLQEYIRHDEVGGGGVGEGDVVGPAAAVVGSVATYSNVSGKVIADLQQILVTESPTVQRTRIGESGAAVQGRTTYFDLVDAQSGMLGSFALAPNTLQNSVTYFLPALSGNLMVDAMVAVSPGNLRYRSAGATGVGLPDTEVPVSVAVANNSIVLRGAAGTVSVANATANEHAVNLLQADARYVRSNDATVLRTTNVVQNLSSPQTSQVISTNGLVSVLSDYVKTADLPDGGDAASLNIVFIDSSNLPFNAALNTLVIVGNISANGTINFPVAPTDKAQIVLCTNDITPGSTITVSGNGKTFFGNGASTFPIRSKYRKYAFQFSESNNAWVAVSMSEYTPTNITASNAPMRLVGSVSLGSGSLPTFANYVFGDTLEILVGSIIGGVTYRAGSWLTKGASSWINYGPQNTEDLETTIDTLIAGFDQLTAALQ